MTEKTYRIKPLVWRWWADSYFLSETAVGYYSVEKRYNGAYLVRTDNIVIGVFETEALAKAAAQEHYESRLKQCLEEVTE